jgi:hypothetical protein
MSATETPGSHLAGLRVQYGGRWRIDKSNLAYMARHRSTGRHITATSLPELEAALLAEGEWGTSR